MAKIFLSYAHKDNLLARIISEGLTKAGHDVFYDAELSLGDNWQNVLTKALNEADVVISLITENSVNSEAVMREFLVSTGYFKERGKPRVMPVVFDGVQVPDELSRILYLRASKGNIDEVINRLVDALNSLIGHIKAKEDERREVHEKVEKTAAEYIKSSLDELRQREKRYRIMAYISYLFASVSLMVCIVFGIWRGSLLLSKVPLSTALQIQFTIISFLIVSLIIALSRFAFVLGKSFMVESLRNADRIHAISFGEFYLKAFGEKVEWHEVKEAFQHWNIDSGSSFTTQNTSDYDPEIMKTAVELAKVVLSKTKN